MNTFRRLIQTSAIFSILFLVGCAGGLKHMQVVAPDAVNEAPSPGKSMVVFMRPSTLGFAVQSSVFDTTRGGEPELVGLVAAKKKVAYESDPGKREFMVIGESADFMEAKLLANKTYFVNVSPRMGVWKARFSLNPLSGVVPQDEIDEYVADTDEVKVNELGLHMEKDLPLFLTSDRGSNI